MYGRLRADGLVDFDPTLDLRVDRSASRPVIDVTDADVLGCRWAAETAIDAATRYAPTWGLFESGGGLGEIGMADWADVSPDASRVSVVDRGGRRRSLVTTDWAREALLRARPNAQIPAIAVISSTSYDSRRTAVAHVIAEIMRRAGVRADARSITAWVARSRFAETGRIEAAATAIGFRSLDRTAELIGHEWRRGDA